MAELKASMGGGGRRIVLGGAAYITTRLPQVFMAESALAPSFALSKKYRCTGLTT